MRLTSNQKTFQLFEFTIFFSIGLILLYHSLNLKKILVRLLLHPLMASFFVFSLLRILSLSLFLILLPFLPNCMSLSLSTCL